MLLSDRVTATLTSERRKTVTIHLRGEEYGQCLGEFFISSEPSAHAAMMQEKSRPVHCPEESMVWFSDDRPGQKSSPIPQGRPEACHLWPSASRDNVALFSAAADAPAFRTFAQESAL